MINVWLENKTQFKQPDIEVFSFLESVLIHKDLFILWNKSKWDYWRNGIHAICTIFNTIYFNVSYHRKGKAKYLVNGIQTLYKTLTIPVLLLYFVSVYISVLSTFFFCKVIYVQCIQHNICWIRLKYIYIPFVFHIRLFTKKNHQTCKFIIHECTCTMNFRCKFRNHC